jgi:hypothetical protein
VPFNTVDGVILGLREWDGKGEFKWEFLLGVFQVLWSVVSGRKKVIPDFAEVIKL